MTEAKEYSLADAVSAMRASWLVIFVAALAGGLIAGTIAFLSKPIYRAEALLSPTPDSQQGGGSALSRLAEQFAPLASIIGGVGGASGMTKEVRIATLKSRQLTETFILEKNLLPVLFADRWDAAARKWQIEEGKSRQPTMEQAFRFFDQEIRKVEDDRKTGLISVAIEWTDPAAAAEWANELVKRSNEYLRQRAIIEARRSTSFLEAELAKTAVVERQQIIYRLIESKTGEIMMANSRPEFAFEVIDPAFVADLNHFVRPKRPALVLVGLILGFCCGAGYAIVRSASRSRTSG